ncbi:threonine-phosphate decarboxylase CobD [Neomoorella mulderi]|uniref:threonine-phosphate decarboxylase n=1 Tax=Moorella mulderi DSM 14980 TaxID=1122241 RepID=A0A151AU49_9FIRM|nr:threonine-phosphate decarboxylase CobD [Moorella mulderi]KYH31102.1 threonine-phosphate decarboxylase [Moorella mulderi DSM 14980]
MVYGQTGNSGRELARPVHGGDWQGAVEKYGWQPEDILDFSANINPLGPPAGVLETLQQNLQAIQRYPDPYCRQLKKALADYLQVDAAAIIAANGATELIYLICQALKPRRVLIPEPTFSEYRRAALVAGAEVLMLELDPASSFALDIARWRQNLAQVDLAFLCNPNNPTGQLLERAVLKEIVDLCQRYGVFLLVDESFLDFLPNWPELSLGSRAAAREGLLSLRSLTKIFALPGLRLGCGVGHPELVARLEARRDPWSVNILAQIAGAVALADREYLEATRELIRREKEYLYHGLAGLAGFRPYHPEVNFILTDITASGLTVPQLAAHLARERILIRDCSSFPGLGPAYFRVAVRERWANQKLLAALEKAVEES